MRNNTWDFPDVIKFRVAVHTISEKAILFRHPVNPDYDPESGSRSKVDQFVHVPTSVDTQNVIQIHARVFE